MRTIFYSFKLALLAGMALLAATAAQAVDFHVSTAQGFQNALTAAQGNGANNNIWLTNGYYEGNFSYNSSQANSLQVLAELNLTNGQVAIDGEAGGVDLNISCAGATGNVTVSNITFIRNTGSYNVGALRIAASSGGTTIVNGCQFLTPNTTSQGMGLVIASGLNTTILNCYVTGKTNGTVYDGDGINISGVTGTTLIYSNTISGNFRGSGLDITASAVLSVSNNLIQTNSYYGIYFDPASGTRTAVLVVSNNVISGCASVGGGYYATSLNNFGTVNMGGNVFYGNVAGGPYMVTGNLAVISGNTFNQNGYFNGYLGGLGVQSLNVVIVNGNTFTGNEGGDGGGGAYFYANYTNILAGNTFTGNSDYDGNGGGAACFVAQGGGTINIVSNNIFSANSIDGPGGALSFSSSGTSIVTNNTFTGNSCSGNYGGGAVSFSGGTNFVTANTFLQNSSADGGGAIYAVGPVINLTLSDNLIVNNSQSGASADGGGIYVDVMSNLFMINNTVFNNTSGGGGGGAAFIVGAAGTVLNVFNNIIWGNSATGSGADVYLTGSGVSQLFQYNDANGMYGVWNNTLPLLNASPNFFNPISGTSSGDYHLQPTSPCLNYGTNGTFLPLTDLDGNIRTNSAGLVDLGCYEFNTNAVFPADTNGSYTITPGEYNAYAAAWKAGTNWIYAPTNAPNPNPIPANYVTRAGYLMTNGGSYYNNGSARPTNWQTNAVP